MQRVEAGALRTVATELMEALGTPGPAAEKVAASLVDADLRGHESHGVIRMATTYGPMIREGDLDPEAGPTVDRPTETTISIDGNGAYGQLVGREAVDTGLERAAEVGTAVVGIRNATHLGRVGEWAERAADGGLLFLAFVNTGGTAMTVTVPGSADRLFSTNPIAFGVPTFDELPFPVVLDVATSQVAHGKITKRAVDRTHLPPEWTIDAQGASVEDPEAFEEGAGAVLPLGGQTAGHKGYGLAVMAELLAGIAGCGTVVGEEAPDWVNNSAMFVLVDPSLFCPRERIEEIIASVHAHVEGASYPSTVTTGPSTKGDRALLPGEPEYETYSRRIEEGIPVTARTREALSELAESLDVEIAAF